MTILLGIIYQLTLSVVIPIYVMVCHINLVEDEVKDLVNKGQDSRKRQKEIKFSLEKGINAEYQEETIN